MADQLLVALRRLLEVLADGPYVHRTLHPQGPAERPASNRKVEALEVAVQPRTTTGESTTRVRDQYRDTRARDIGIDVGTRHGVGPGHHHSQQP